MGPIRQGTPHVIETKTEPAALLYWRGQSSTAVRSSPSDLRDLAHRLSYTVEPLVGVSNDGGAHGGTEVRADGEMPVEATAAPTKAWTSISRPWRTYITSYHSQWWTEASQPLRRGSAMMLGRGRVRCGGLTKRG